MQKLELTQVWDKKFPKSEKVDLYDDVAGVVPYDKMEAFFNENLN